MSDLEWMDDWKRMDVPRRERLGNAIGRLLEQGILVKGPVASPDEDYRALDRQVEQARGFLRTIGWDLTIDRVLGVVQAINLSGRCRVRFNKEESIILCLLRLLFQERAGTVAWDDQIMVSVGDLYEAFNTHMGARRPPGKQDLAAALRQFQQLKLVKLSRPFEPEPDTVIELLPTIQMALPTSALDRVATRLRDYASGARDNEASQESSEDGSTG
jgi:nucleotide-binding universal stress UspA family protein